MSLSRLIILRFWSGSIDNGRSRRGKFSFLASSNERIELTNHRSYHQVLQSPYLYALDRQNVTCNWYDEKNMRMISIIDTHLFCSVSIPFVIPVCNRIMMFMLVSIVWSVVLIARARVYVRRRSTGSNAKKSVKKANICSVCYEWLLPLSRCLPENSLRVSDHHHHHDEVTTTTSTAPLTTLEETTTLRTTTTTATTVESTAIVSNTNHIDQTTEVIEHTNNLLSSETETSSIAPTTKESHLPNEGDSSSTFVPSTSSQISAVETTSTPEDEPVASSTISGNDYITTSEAKQKEETDQTTASSTEPSTTHQPRLIHLLTNSSHSVPSDNVTPATTMVTENISETSTGRSSDQGWAHPYLSLLLAAITSLNPCTLENLRANLVYHEYSPDKHKFIFCDSEGKMNVIACSPSYVWSQMEQSCILPN